MMGLIKPNIVGFFLPNLFRLVLLFNGRKIDVSTKQNSLFSCVYTYTLVCYLFIAYDHSNDAVQSYKSLTNHLCVIFGHFCTLFIRI